MLMLSFFQTRISHTLNILAASPLLIRGNVLLIGAKDLRDLSSMESAHSRSTRIRREVSKEPILPGRGVLAMPVRSASRGARKSSKGQCSASAGSRNFLVVASDQQRDARKHTVAHELGGVGKDSGVVDSGSERQFFLEHGFDELVIGDGAEALDLGRGGSGGAASRDSKVLP